MKGFGLSILESMLITKKLLNICVWITKLINSKNNVLLDDDVLVIETVELRYNVSVIKTGQFLKIKMK